MLTPHNATILIVDDSPENLMVLTELLSPHYRVLAAQSGKNACASSARIQSLTSFCWM